MNNKIDFETLEKIKNEFGTFQLGQVMGGGNDVYLRFGYWSRVNVVKLQESWVIQSELWKMIWMMMIVVHYTHIN